MTPGCWLASAPNLTGFSQRSGVAKLVMACQSSEIGDHNRLKTLPQNLLDGISASKSVTCLKPETLTVVASSATKSIFTAVKALAKFSSTTYTQYESLSK